MNTPVNFEIAKLLKEKSYDNVTDLIYMTNHTAEVLFENINGLKHSDGNNPFCSAPTISEVLMWLHEKHGIWIYTKPNLDEDGEWIFKGYVKLMNDFKAKEYQTGLVRQPAESYSEAILYTLQNLI